MAEHLSTFGHLLIILAFVVLVIDIHRNQRQLYRTTRRGRWLYKLASAQARKIRRILAIGAHPDDLEIASG